jgi:hypothetical protein
MRSDLLILVLFLVGSLHGQDKYGRQDLAKIPSPPDYTNLYFWAAHPALNDYADRVPGKGEITENQEDAPADVFFVHPTIYTGKQNEYYPWNADLYLEKLNNDVDKSTIKNQASVFNGSCKVYAPRYRQAHIEVFKTKDPFIKDSALNIAYTDVKKAFEVYMENFNNGRPFILASHSQGTVHAERLLDELIQNKSLQKQLICAYLVGMPIKKTRFYYIPPCSNPEEIGCWISWNTYAENYYPESFNTDYAGALSTNPLSWKLDEQPVSRKMNIGGVLRNYKKIRPGLNDARNHQGVLWIEKPRFFGNFLFNWKRYHVADYNLFYMNIRQNVSKRVNVFIESAAKTSDVSQ